MNFFRKSNGGVVLFCAFFAAAFAAAGRAEASACAPTKSDDLGPYYVADMPVLEDINRFGRPGEPLEVSGVVRSAAEGHSPVAGANLEVWHADGEGKYHPGDIFTDGARGDYDDKDLDLRGTVLTDKDGRYAYRTVVPGGYGFSLFRRPPHFHYRISAPGFRMLVTQHYIIEGGRASEDACRSAEVERGGGAKFAAPDIFIQPEKL